MKDNSSDDKKKLQFVKPTVPQYIILAFGLVLVIAGLFLLINNFPSSGRVLVWRPVLCLCLCLVLLYISLALTHSTVLFYLGINFLLTGIFFLLTDSGIISVGMKRLWPSIVIGSGISLIPASIYCKKTITSSFVFPSIIITSLGVIFLLFSLGVIKMSFARFVAQFWPALIIIGGICLIVIFLYQQHNRKNFPYMADDTYEDENL